MPKPGTHRTNYCIVCGSTDWSLMRYQFPKCPERRAKWLASLGLQASEIRKRSRVCEKHFPRDKNNRSRIHRGTVPVKWDVTLVQVAKPKPAKPQLQIIEILELPNTDNNDPKKMWWNDKIYLVDHCAFCLEPIKTPEEKDTDQKEVSVEDNLSFPSLWPYLHGPRSSSSVQGEEAFYKFVRDKDQEGEWMCSKVPPICSNVCMANLKKLNDQYLELLQIKLKLEQQTKLVNETAVEIRQGIRRSHRAKRSQVQDVLNKADVTSACIANTTVFLDSLSGPQNNMVPIAPKDAVPVTILPTTSGTTQNQMLILDPNFILQQGPSTSSQNLSQSSVVTCVQPTPGLLHPVTTASPIVNHITSVQTVQAKPKTQTQVQVAKIHTTSNQNQPFINLQPHKETVEKEQQEFQPKVEPEDDEEQLIDLPGPPGFSVIKERMEIEEDDDEDNDNNQYATYYDDPLA